MLRTLISQGGGHHPYHSFLLQMTKSVHKPRAPEEGCCHVECEMRHQEGRLRATSNAAQQLKIQAWTTISQVSNRGSNFLNDIIGHRVKGHLEMRDINETHVEVCYGLKKPRVLAPESQTKGR